MKLTPHFSLKEFYVSSSYPELAAKMKITKLDQFKFFYLCNTILEPIRNYIKKPMSITSGKRSTELNAKVGGSKTSEHRCWGYAVSCDFRFEDGQNIDYYKTFDFLMAKNKFAVSQAILYFRHDLSVKHLHVGLANDKNQSEFMIKREDGPFENFKGVWPK